MAKLAHRLGPAHDRLFAISVTLGGVVRRFYVRGHSAGDLGAFHQIFVNHDYNIEMFRRHADLDEKYRQIVAAGDTPLILDAGANIGASVVWFSAAYPHSHMIAIEPEKKNCRLLEKNCEGLDYSLVEAGLGARAGTLFVQDPGISDWGFRLGKSGDYPVPVVCAEELVGVATSGRQVPFIAKIDIEGGEEDLFSERVEWLARFPLVIIELHDWLFPGEARSRNFLRAISSMNVDVVYRNENLFCFNNDLL